MNNKAVTLVEIIIVALMTSIMFGAIISMVVVEMRLTERLLGQMQLEQDRFYLIQHIQRHIHGSAFVDIALDPTKIRIYDQNEALLGTYSYAGTTLSYDDNPLSGIVSSFTVVDAEDPNNTEEIRYLNINFSMDDTQRSTFKAVDTSLGFLACERSYTPKPRDVVYNFNKDELYDHIQEAIDGVKNASGTYIKEKADLGDEIRVMGANTKEGFDGVFRFDDTLCKQHSVVTVEQGIILKGSYDKDFLTQDINNTPTIIDGGVIYAYDMDNNRSVSNTSNSYRGIQVICGALSSGDIIVNGFVIKNCYNSMGAGISVSISDSSARCTISNNIIMDNTGSHGGGIKVHANGLVDNTDSCTISNNTIQDNQATYGGGINAKAQYADSFKVLNNTITCNKASTSGGGIYAWAQFDTASFSIFNNSITFNTASYGGGIDANAQKGKTSFAISHNLAEYNTARNEGGGIRAQSLNDSISVNKSVASNNLVRGNTRDEQTGVTAGGGIYARALVNGKIILSNNLITDNNASSQGSGVYALAQDSDGVSGNAICTILNNTIANNKSSKHGSGLYANAKQSNEIYVLNSIIYNNGGSSNNYEGTGTGTIEELYCNIEGYPNTKLIPSNIDQDPEFVNTANNDYRLKSKAADDNSDGAADYTVDSPCIDTGYPYDTTIDYLDPGTGEDFSNPDELNYGTAMAPARKTRRNDMGAYGGPGAGNPIGTYTPIDDDTTLYINENVIGTY
jgi:hypothetical protein